nr:DUF5666 domain-containing protein [Rhizobium terrae]
MSPLSRRGFLFLAAGLQFCSVREVLGNDRPIAQNDHGIGGTGLSVDGGDDNGIGGTGIVGTIQRFGSIIVNDKRVTYDRSTPVFMDGVRSTTDAMRLGHVVRIVLSNNSIQPHASAIHVTSEVKGRIEAIDRGRMTVLSQSVELTQNAAMPRLRKGMMVAVFGIRKPDGTIVASRVEEIARNAMPALRGVAEFGGGRLTVGGLPLESGLRQMAGKRIVVEFALRGQQPVMKRLRQEELVPGLRSGTVNVETYADRRGEQVRLGVGINVKVQGGLPAQASSPSFFDLSVDPRGNLSSPVQDHGGRLPGLQDREAPRGPAPPDASPPGSPGKGGLGGLGPL